METLLVFFFLSIISYPRSSAKIRGLIFMRELPEEIEIYRDRKWRREESLKVDSAEDVEALVEDLGFCLGLTDARTGLPSVYTAVCGRRDAHLPRNVQKDYEASRAWVLKDEVIALTFITPN